MKVTKKMIDQKLSHHHKMDTAEIEKEISDLQEVQKTHAPKSRAWKMSSDLLKPLMWEMARRQREGLL